MWLKCCRYSFLKMINEKLQREMEEKRAKAQVLYAQPDDLINFYHLKGNKVSTACDLQTCKRALL